MLRIIYLSIQPSARVDPFHLSVYARDVCYALFITNLRQKSGMEVKVCCRVDYPSLFWRCWRQRWRADRPMLADNDDSPLLHSIFNNNCDSPAWRTGEWMMALAMTFYMIATVHTLCPTSQMRTHSLLLLRRRSTPWRRRWWIIGRMFTCLGEW